MILGAGGGQRAEARAVRRQRAYGHRGAPERPTGRGPMATGKGRNSPTAGAHGHRGGPGQGRLEGKRLAVGEKTGLDRARTHKQVCELEFDN